MPLWASQTLCDCCRGPQCDSHSSFAASQCSLCLLHSAGVGMLAGNYLANRMCLYITTSATPAWYLSNLCAHLTCVVSHNLCAHLCAISVWKFSAAKPGSPLKQPAVCICEPSEAVGTTSPWSLRFGHGGGGRGSRMPFGQCDPVNVAKHSRTDGFLQDQLQSAPYPSHSVITGSEYALLPDGSEYAPLRNGSEYAPLPDGREYAPLPDGREYAPLPNASEYAPLPDVTTLSSPLGQRICPAA
ncbi:hypothetical protein JZ751_015538 [Albula glossodonta]|uniref:Uncharacterized protein n=1 Tax=Albula glossodonta TaxID=121402 RepID=A0A8T2N6X3_9TELE|nr:hypothetical protein JZ751_015538 [Albula glossodonta]